MADPAYFHECDSVVDSPEDATVGVSEGMRIVHFD